MKYSAAEVIEMAVRTERAGQQFYRAVGRSTGDEPVRQLFIFLAAEEEKHARRFESLSRMVRETPEEQPYDWDQAALYLKAISDSRYFLGQGRALDPARAAATPIQALDSALGFEKETLLFFLELLDAVGPKARPVVAELIRQEKDHVCRLKAIRDSLP